MNAPLVTCPACGAQPIQRCIGLVDGKVPGFWDFHEERIAAAAGVKRKPSKKKKTRGLKK